MDASTMFPDLHPPVAAPAKKWLLPSELAKVADCHRGTVNNARKKGRIPKHLYRRHPGAGRKAFYDYAPEAAEFLVHL